MLKVIVYYDMDHWIMGNTEPFQFFTMKISDKEVELLRLFT